MHAGATERFPAHTRHPAADNGICVQLQANASKNGQMPSYSKEFFNAIFKRIIVNLFFSPHTQCYLCSFTQKLATFCRREKTVSQLAEGRLTTKERCPIRKVITKLYSKPGLANLCYTMG